MDRAVLREDLIDGLEHDSKGVLSDPRVGVAMREVPRHEFVPDERLAYEDRDQRHLGSRILAPRTVARMLEALAPRPGDDVLIVGTGVGYTAAVLAEIVGDTHVHGVDISRSLVYEARANLASAGYSGVFIDRRDGANGVPEYAPFDRILVEAAVAEPPRSLLEQLTPDGRIVVPCGTSPQHLMAIHPTGRRERFDAVSFDPLLVDGEQAGSIERNRTAREDVEFARQQAESRRGWELDWLDWES